MSFSKDLGRLLENMVFIHLLRKKKKVFYFRQKKECDFIVTNNGKVEMVLQVCYELNADNLTREVNGLVEALIATEQEEGAIFTLNQEDFIEDTGKKIMVKPVWKWMLE